MLDRTSFIRHGLLSAPNLLTLTPSTLEGKWLVLYFSASWCAPCRAYTPQLNQLAGEVDRSKVDFIFVSCDRSEDAFNGYFGTKMSNLWAIPFSSVVREELQALCKVRGIPAVVVISPEDQIITNQGRRLLNKAYVESLIKQ